MPSNHIRVRLDLTELKVYDPTDDTLLGWDGDEPYILWSVVVPPGGKAAGHRKEFATDVDDGESAMENAVPLVGPVSLAPGERATLLVSVMEKDDGNGTNTLEVLGSAALALFTGGPAAFDGVLVGAALDELVHQLAKGGDDEIGVVAFTLENVAGKLVKRMRTVRRFKHVDPSPTRQKFSKTRCTIRVVSKYTTNGGSAGVQYHAGFVVRDGTTLAPIPWTAADSPSP